MCTKFKVAILKNGWVMAFSMPKKVTFYAIYEDFASFPIFNVSDLGGLKSDLGSFFAFLTNIWLKNMYGTTQT